MSQKQARQTFWTMVAAGCLLAAAEGFFFPPTGVIATIVRDFELALAGFAFSCAAIKIVRSFR